MRRRVDASPEVKIQKGGELAGDDGGAEPGVARPHQLDGGEEERVRDPTCDAELPLAAQIGDKTLVLHGGLFRGKKRAKRRGAKATLTVGTLAELQASDDPWLVDYFHGPRAEHHLERH